MYKSTGSLSTWGEKDFISEMMSQREAMCDTNTSSEERLKIIQNAFLLLACCADEDKYVYESHWNEMTKRNFMIMELEIEKAKGVDDA